MSDDDSRSPAAGGDHRVQTVQIGGALAIAAPIEDFLGDD